MANSIENNASLEKQVLNISINFVKYDELATRDKAAKSQLNIKVKKNPLILRRIFKRFFTHDIIY